VTDLGPRLEDDIVAALRRIVRAIDIHSKALAEACGLTGPQLAVLRALSRLGPTPISGLAKAVSLSQPTVSGIVARLESHGLVRRRRGNEDQRTVLVNVTPKGSRTISTAPSLLQDRVSAQLEQLEEWERTLILSTLQRLATMMDAEQLDASPILEVGPVDGVGVERRSETMPTTAPRVPQRRRTRGR